MKAVDLTGHRFGILTAIKVSRIRAKKRLWLCRCACGNEAEVRTDDLRSGKQVSCGCHKDAQTAARNKANAKHGMTHTGVYRSWFAMRDRCEDPQSPSWQWYGAKGVKVCDRWQDFLAFYEDMGHRPEGHTLDRIDPTGNYEPGNCRWATPKEQRANQRDTTV